MQPRLPLTAAGLVNTLCRQAVQQHRPKMVFLTSPNNPDGSMLADEDVSGGCSADVKLWNGPGLPEITCDNRPSARCCCMLNATVEGDSAAARAGGAG
jgi:hypothetical protein